MWRGWEQGQYFLHWLNNYHWIFKVFLLECQFLIQVRLMINVHNETSLCNILVPSKNNFLSYNIVPTFQCKTQTKNLSNCFLSADFLLCDEASASFLNSVTSLISSSSVPQCHTNFPKMKFTKQKCSQERWQCIPFKGMLQHAVKFAKEQYCLPNFHKKISNKKAWAVIFSNKILVTRKSLGFLVDWAFHLKYFQTVFKQRCRRMYKTGKYLEHLLLSQRSLHQHAGEAGQHSFDKDQRNDARNAQLTSSWPVSAAAQSSVQKTRWTVMQPALLSTASGQEEKELFQVKLQLQTGCWLWWKTFLI